MSATPSPPDKDGAAAPTRAASPSMHRLYARYERQRVTHKTTTESAAVAAFAWDELCAQATQLTAAGAIGIAWTENGRQREYRTLAGDRTAAEQAKTPDDQTPPA